MLTLNGKTSVVGIIGCPIRHSLSPVMQNAAFAASNIDYVYVPFEVKPDNLEQAVIGLRALGVTGFNVTIPHKTSIIPFLDGLDKTAEEAGAVNTVTLSGTSLIGYNTDGDGLVDSLAKDLGFSPDAGKILILGAGGAARGAIAALCRNGAKNIHLCNRSIENANRIMLDMKSRYSDTRIEVTEIKTLTESDLASTSLLINTTSLGMNNERIEFIDLNIMSKYSKVYDMVYSKFGTPLVNDSTKLGLKAVNGIGMLVAQGERAFEKWTGKKVPDGVMLQALINF